MIHILIESIIGILTKTNISNWLIVMFLSFMPIVETRLGIPIGLRLGMTVGSSWFFSFLGSSLAAPFVILLFTPIVEKIKTSTKNKKPIAFFDKIFEKHAKKISQKLTDKPASSKNKDLKKMLAVITFVAIPGPMTGVWGGAVVSTILKLSYVKSIISVTIGNFIASLFVLLLSEFLYSFLDYIIFIILIMGVISIISLCIRFLITKINAKKLNLKQPT